MVSPSVHYGKVASLGSNAASSLGDFIKRSASQIESDLKLSVRTGVEARIMFAFGGGALLVGAILVSFMLVFLLTAILPLMPLWLCFGIVSIPVLIVAYVTLRGGQQKLAQLDVVGKHISDMVDDAKGVAGSLGAAVHAVESVGQDAAETVSSTIESVKQGVETVKHSVDLKYQVQEHPWTMLAGASLLGFLGGTLLNNAAGPDAGPAGAEPHTGGQGMLNKLSQAIAPEAQMLRDMAIGSLMAFATDAVRGSLGGAAEKPLNDIFDRAAAHFGARTTATAPRHPSEQDLPKHKAAA